MEVWARGAAKSEPDGGSATWRGECSRGMERPIVIGIGGPSGGGKTTVAGALRRRLGVERCAIVRVDDYYRDLAHLPIEQRAAWNFDAPDAIEHELLVADMEALVMGRSIRSPVYSFVTHTRTDETRAVAWAPFIVIEGTLALHWRELREAMDVRAYVDADEQVCFGRRMRRDTEERGRDPHGVRRQWQETVWPMHVLYVLPSRAYADIVLDGSDAAAASEELYRYVQATAPDRT
ncbi:MAG: uridine kinase [Chthonomonadales bacterium]|nr:uridine kinase [Chthonomonadales bacterium]